MADYSSLTSSTEKLRSLTLSLFSSPRLLAGFVSKGLTDTESLMSSPTSTLDSRELSSFNNPFWSDLPTPKTTKTPKLENRNLWEKLDSRCAGLGLADVLTREESDYNLSKPDSRMVIFGSQLKIQIPPLLPSALSPSDSPKSPGDFGIKTRNSQLGTFSPCLSPSPMRKTLFRSANFGPENPNSHRVFVGSLSASEMDSEDYTCVISHGPNPRTTHIFDDCIVETSPGVAWLPATKKGNGSFDRSSRSCPCEDFLSICFKCKKKLEQGTDVYMLRGEKAFCSSECRNKEMMFEGGMDKVEYDEVNGHILPD